MYNCIGFSIHCPKGIKLRIVNIFPHTCGRLVPFHMHKTAIARRDTEFQVAPLRSIANLSGYNPISSLKFSEPERKITFFLNVSGDAEKRRDLLNEATEG